MRAATKQTQANAAHPPTQTTHTHTQLCHTLTLEQDTGRSAFRRSSLSLPPASGLPVPLTTARHTVLRAGGCASGREVCARVCGGGAWELFSLCVSPPAVCVPSSSSSSDGFGRAGSPITEGGSRRAPVLTPAGSLTAALPLWRKSLEITRRLALSSPFLFFFFFL